MGRKAIIWPKNISGYLTHTASLNYIELPHDDVIKWKHFPALLGLWVGNSPVSGEFPRQRPVTRSLGVFFDMRPNKRLSKQPWGWWFETPSHPLRRHRYVAHMGWKAMTWPNDISVYLQHIVSIYYIELPEFTMKTSWHGDWFRITDHLLFAICHSIT